MLELEGAALALQAQVMLEAEGLAFLAKVQAEPLAVLVGLVAEMEELLQPALVEYMAVARDITRAAVKELSELSGLEPLGNSHQQILEMCK